jgi:hypothetical protein
MSDGARLWINAVQLATLNAISLSSEVESGRRDTFLISSCAVDKPDSTDAYRSVNNRLLKTTCSFCLNCPLNLTGVCELLQQIRQNTNI